MESAGEKTHGKLEWFFYMILLPLLFTLILTGILLNFLGYNIKGMLLDWGNSIPYVEKVVPGTLSKSEGQPAEKSKETVEAETAKKQVAQMNQKLQQEKAQQAALKTETVEKEKQIQELQQQVDQLKKQMDEQKQEVAQNNQAEQEVAQVYASMSASKAAPILEKMSQEQAVRLLKAMNQEERGAILAKLEPSFAAKITTQLLAEQ